MKKFFLKKETISNPIFSYDVVIVITNDFEKAAKKLDLPNPPETCEAATFNVESSPESFIFLEKNADPGTIAHEAWHVVHQILKEHASAGLENEVVAYHLGYYVREIHDILKGARKCV